jgi:archaeal flagellar protein FlaJ
MVAPTQPRRSSFVRSLRDVTDSDLYYQLTYMSATASAGTTRNQIFALASKVDRPTSPYFEKIRLLAEKLGYDYARACGMVGQAVRSSAMKSLLLRLSNSLVSGQSEADFLSEEVEVQGEMYEKEYERELSSLLKWTDAYGAIIVSTALIIIVNLVSTMIYSLGMGLIVGMVGLAVFTAMGGTWVLARSAPDEERELFTSEGPRSQVWALRLAKITPWVLLATCGIMAIARFPLGWILMVVALELLPLGVASLLGGREINAKDREIGPFLRSLGATTVSTGTTLTEAMTRIDLDSFPGLTEDLARLRHRQQASIEPRLCWNKFALETGSALINGTISVFNDAVTLGGDADTVGLFASQFANRTVMLRAKREVVTSTFVSLTLVVHGAMSALMVIIMEVMTQFIEMIWSAAVMEDGAALQGSIMPLPSLDDPQIVFLSHVTTAMVLLLALANALAMSATDGGHKFKLAFYLSVLLAISGACFVFLPPMIVRLLSS